MFASVDLELTICGDWIGSSVVASFVADETFYHVDPRNLAPRIIEDATIVGLNLHVGISFWASLDTGHDPSGPIPKAS